MEVSEYTCSMNGVLHGKHVIEDRFCGWFLMGLVIKMMMLMQFWSFVVVLTGSPPGTLDRMVWIKRIQKRLSFFFFRIQKKEVIRGTWMCKSKM